MIYQLLYGLHDHFSALNVLRYANFRALMAAMSALLIMIGCSPWFLRKLTELKYGQQIRSDGPETHFKKGGTPTMGGLLMLLSIVVATLAWADLREPKIWVGVAVVVGFGVVGFLDDYAKIKRKSHLGLRGTTRLVIEFGIALGAILALLHFADFDTRVAIPFVSVEKWHPDFGWLYIPLVMMVIVGTANAVNLTDGLDGLATGPVIVSALTFLVMAYAAGLVVGGFNVAEYLHLPYIAGATELGVFCVAIAMAGVGFLWMNAYPASIFMGDVGSLSLGAGLGVLAVLTKQELVSVIIHGVFLAEALSVIAQVTSFKLTGKRVLAMAPLHHHFEKKGWPEPKIVVRFWIVSILLAMVSLATLKLR